MAAIELALGIGCQRGTSAALLARGVDAALSEVAGVVRILATIDRKRDEAGLLQLAQERGWTLAFHSAGELGSGVAEPAACKHGRLLMRKRVYREPNVSGSMTIAIAELER
ncbi:MAG TPA: cobalamin biosynthesis protein [Polyangiales bacterium]|nr:cobalamin biosynthesis protein [Polyangiales bacterium]